MNATQPQHHILSVLVENKFGVLTASRVCSRAAASTSSRSR